MYIRQISRKNKDGTVTRYVQLAHNERHPVTGTPQAKILYHFGRADELDTVGLKRLAASIHRFIGEPLPSGSPPPRSATVTLLKSKALGGAWLLDQLWKKLGIGEAITRRLADREFRMPVERAIFAMVANRVLDPGSKLAIEDWVDREVVIPDLPAFEVQHGYRAMDFLLESDESIQREVFHTVADLLNLEVDLLFFDTTSTYFETEESEEDAFRRTGYSKDHRPDLPQAVIGFAVTRDGIPIRCWVWPGNTSDMSVVPEVKKDLIGWKLGRVITVVDRGFCSEDNLRVLQQTGGHYIAGEKMTSGKPTVEAALAHPGRFKTVRDNLEVKEIVVGDGEARTRYVLVRNPDEAKRDAARREKHLEALRAELARLKELDGDTHTKAHCRLHSHVTYKRYLKIDKRGNLRIDLQAVKAMEHLDGKYLLRTSDDTLSTEDVALGYKQLLKVESAFRTLKQSLELRPVYHRKEERIRAHVLLCWLGLMLIRIIENQTGQTWREVRSLMQMLHLVEYRLDAGTLCQRTQLTPEQQAIVSALGLKEPQQIWDISLL
ncbi:transposase [Paenibacillus sp. D9]|uniref:IS1634 family transposase n=1 Tax=Paenibacillus sp. D9 TaxID=665792 RepID=UPI00061E0480|nr:IS1634 family transposase [Paenibacillus sp. D9]KKC45811.1 transposase [Paenibacillus sp. D9]KKC47740.1 transposase [Paenibacillus sp. D9]KKC47776.1 transposase [Paenibacillus sp. D9]